VEATPKEAQDLIYIISTAPSNIYFTLRNPNDRAVPPRLPSSTSDTVLGRSAEAPAPVAPVVVPQSFAPQQPMRQPVPTALPKKKGTFRDF